MTRMTRLAATLALAVLGSLAAAGCSNSADAYLESDNAFYEEGKHHVAIVEYRNAVQQDAAHGPARLRLAQADEQLGELPQAVREYIRTADLLPDAAETQVKAGTFLLLARDFEAADARAEQALRANPSSVDAQILLGIATAGLKDLDGAVREIQEAISLAPAEGRGYSNLGAIQLAQAAFRKAVEVEPSLVQAHLALGSRLVALAFAEGRKSDAYSTIGEVELARVAGSQRNFDQAEQALRTAIELDPAAMEAYGLLGQVYLAQNRMGEAIRDFETITLKDPKAIGAHTLIGRILQTQGRTDEGVDRYERTVQIE